MSNSELLTAFQKSSLEIILDKYILNSRAGEVAVESVLINTDSTDSAILDDLNNIYKDKNKTIIKYWIDDLTENSLNRIYNYTNGLDNFKGFKIFVDTSINKICRINFKVSTTYFEGEVIDNLETSFLISQSYPYFNIFNVNGIDPFKHYKLDKNLNNKIESYDYFRKVLFTACIKENNNISLNLPLENIEYEIYYSFNKIRNQNRIKEQPKEDNTIGVLGEEKTWYKYNFSDLAPIPIPLSLRSIERQPFQLFINDLLYLAKYPAEDSYLIFKVKCKYKLYNQIIEMEAISDDYIYIPPIELDTEIIYNSEESSWYKDYVLNDFEDINKHNNVSYEQETKINEEGEFIFDLRKDYFYNNLYLSLLSWDSSIDKVEVEITQNILNEYGILEEKNIYSSKKSSVLDINSSYNENGYIKLQKLSEILDQGEFNFYITLRRGYLPSKIFKFSKNKIYTFPLKDGDIILQLNQFNPFWTQIGINNSISIPNYGNILENPENFVLYGLRTYYDGNRFVLPSKLWITKVNNIELNTKILLKDLDLFEFEDQTESLKENFQNTLFQDLLKDSDNPLNIFPQDFSRIYNLDLVLEIKDIFGNSIKANYTSFNLNFDQWSLGSSSEQYYSIEKKNDIPYFQYEQYVYNQEQSKSIKELTSVSLVGEEDKIIFTSNFNYFSTSEVEGQIYIYRSDTDFISQSNLIGISSENWQLYKSFNIIPTRDSYDLERKTLEIIQYMFPKEISESKYLYFKLKLNQNNNILEKFFYYENENQIGDEANCLGRSIAHLKPQVRLNNIEIDKDKSQNYKAILDFSQFKINIDPTFSLDDELTNQSLNEDLDISYLFQILVSLDENFTEYEIIDLESWPRNDKGENLLVETQLPNVWPTNYYYIKVLLKTIVGKVSKEAYSNYLIGYATTPTISYRANKIGINYNNFNSAPDNAALVIGSYENKTDLVYIQAGTDISNIGYIRGFIIGGSSWNKNIVKNIESNESIENFENSENSEIKEI